MSTPRRRLAALELTSWYLPILFLGTLLVAAALTFAYAFLLEPWLDRRRPSNNVDPVPGPMTSTPFYWPGIPTPPTRSADQTGLADDAPVFGVLIQGKPRAYALEAFAGPMRHVVNDVVNDVPVTVTFCDRTRCLKAFTSSERGGPLEVDTGGWYNNRLFLRVRGKAYFQDAPRSGEYEESPPFPYEDCPGAQTTWKLWKTKHPDTDVYVGPEKNAGG